jgi:hypothetical protein
MEKSRRKTKNETHRIRSKIGCEGGKADGGGSESGLCYQRTGSVKFCNPSVS